MESIQKLEKRLAGYFKQLPNLPQAGRTWLAENVWWLALISVIISALSLVYALIGVISLVVWTATPVFYGAYYSATAISAAWITSASLTLLFVLVITVLMAQAVPFLRTMRYRGWMLLFTVYLVNALRIVVMALLTGSITGFIAGIIFGAIGLAIVGYFLFQIRSFFGAGEKTSRRILKKK